METASYINYILVAVSFMCFIYNCLIIRCCLLRLNRIELPYWGCTSLCLFLLAARSVDTFLNLTEGFITCYANSTYVQLCICRLLLFQIAQRRKGAFFQWKSMRQRACRIHLLLSIYIEWCLTNFSITRKHVYLAFMQLNAKWFAVRVEPKRWLPLCFLLLIHFLL